ncbi:hypothetical protein Pmani_023684 [Petrolisthes manimaculis]|uniref:Uncharacterized protein n=1 Tax=Petrolisthes manimaculis TaxID=1843537 RepID=A0AAE1U0U7_9EUCA|nr:hypothetical protein Pmani_023684 [Petrolisthes manimaculis]
MDVDNTGNETTTDVQKNGNGTTIQVNNNRNETITDVERKGSWTTIDIMDNNRNRTTMKRTQNSLSKWMLVLIIAGLSLTVICLGVSLAYYLTNENSLCQTDGKLIPPGQTATPPPFLISQTDHVMNQSDVTTTRSPHHQDSTTIPPPIHHHYNATTVLSDEKIRRYNDIQRQEEKLLEQTETCRPINQTVPVKALLSPKDHLLDLYLLTKHVALPLCNGRWCGYNNNNNKGWDGVCREGFCRPIQQGTVKKQLMIWNPSTERMEEHSREFDYHQICECSQGGTQPHTHTHVAQARDG